MTHTMHLSNAPLEQTDPTIHRLNQLERDRQNRKLILIASESVCPLPVRQALASEFGNIYAEGYPAPRMTSLDLEAIEAFEEPFVAFRRYADRRYYKGCDYVNVVETLAQRRLAEAFATGEVPAERIHANVQPLSGAAANNAVYNALLAHGDTIMGMDLTCGGHLTHGSEVNRSGRTYHVVAYRPGKDGRLDYDAIGRLARETRPKLLVAGFSAYPWDIDWPRLRAICDEVGAFLHADIAHTAGLVSAGVLASPVGHAHVISFTTHKSLCGPRGAAILTTEPDLAPRIDLGVFPGEQGGPHVHQIAAKAVAFELARTEEFRTLMARVQENAAALAEAFVAEGARLAYGGTNTHLCLLDLKSVKTASGHRLTGEIASRLLDMLGLTCNKNTIMGDTSASQPTGLRFGTVWVTQRGLGPEHMKRIALVVLRVLRNTHAYEYLYAGGPVGRGKLDFAEWEAARQEIAALAAEAADPSPGDGTTAHYPHTVGMEPLPQMPRPTPLTAAHEAAGARLGERAGWRVPLSFGDVDAEVQAAQQGCAVVDLGDGAAIRVEGGRAENLLQGALTANLLGLEANQCTESLALTRDGTPQDVLTVARLSQPVREPDAFLVVTRGGQGEAIAAWLRALSDGYVLQDEDIYRKVEGPALVRPLADATAVTQIGLYGPEAPAVVAKAFGNGVSPAPGQVSRLEDTLVLHVPGQSRHHVILCPAEIAPELWGKLLEAGATPVGTEAVTRLAIEAGLPAPGASEPAGEALARTVPASLIDLHKPFFVGQASVLSGTASPDPLPEHDFAPPELPLRRTVLYEEHLKHTKKKFLVPFAGWEMPVWYAGIGVEHRAVRLAAGLFDVSHMGVLGVRGRHAERFLDLVTSNYVPWLAPGQCHYSYLLGPAGQVIDDIIVYREAPDRFMVVVNAANAEVDEAWLRAVLAGEVSIDPTHPRRTVDATAELVNLKLDTSLGAERRVDLAFQGPASLPTLLKLARTPTFARQLRELDRFALAQGDLDDVPVLVARTGYTGEDLGYEIFPHPDQAPRLWNLLLDAGAALGVRPTGLGARDSTRCEAGLPLHGHELAGPYGINPLEAGYAPFVRLHKPFFVGRQAMVHALHHWDREIVRFRLTRPGGKGIHPGNKVVDGKRGRFIGHVTSAVSIGRIQMGLALVDRRYAREGDTLAIYARAERDKDPEPKPLSELGPGDQMPLALEAVILPRFAKPDDMHAFAAEHLS